MSEASRLASRADTKFTALAKVVLVAGGTWVMVRAIATLLGDISFMSGALDGLEMKIADAFTRSFLAYVVIITFLVFILRLDALRTAMRSLVLPAPRDAWQIAMITAAINLAMLLTMFVDNPVRVFELSFFNVYVSVITALGGGLGEEAIFRGFIIITLAGAGFGRPAQILMSGGLFGAAHMNWSMAAADAGLLAMLSPLFGTFVLGSFLAWAFQVSGHRLLPVVVAHGLINVIVEPWLAVSYFG